MESSKFSERDNFRIASSNSASSLVKDYPSCGQKRKYMEINTKPRVNSKFTESSIPNNVFSLGNNVFVTVTTFRQKTSIHIRTYKKFGDTYYPSSDGVTMQPQQFLVLCDSDIPATVFDVVHLNLQFESFNRNGDRDFHVQLNDEGDFTVMRGYTCRSGRVYNTTVKLSALQWTELQKVKNPAMNCYLEYMFSERNFKEEFLTISRSEIKKSYDPRADNFDTELERALYDQLCKKGLHRVERIDELPLQEDLNTVEEFNKVALNLNVVELICDFERIIQSSYVKNKIVSEIFLDSVKLEEMLNRARIDFCTLDGI